MRPATLVATGTAIVPQNQGMDGWVCFTQQEDIREMQCLNGDLLIKDMG